MTCGLIYGPDVHHLDHIAPLCCLLDIPLCATEETIAKQAEAFYPRVQVQHVDYLHFPEYLVSHFSRVLCSFPKALFREICFFAEQMLHKHVHTIWCPHGNSDKGHSGIFWEALREEETALLYGKQMRDALVDKGVFDRLRAHVMLGNYRWEFYRTHKAFYDILAERYILSRLPPHNSTYLYAPTWKDAEKSTSFYDALPILAEALPENANLIVKPHPNLMLADPLRTDALIERYIGHPRILFLQDFPPIYPLLALSDVYIGDMSSIGYDFLTFDRPLFFLKQNPSKESAYLYRAGVIVEPPQYKEIYSIIANFFAFELRDFSTMRKEIYAYAFGHPKPLDQLRKEIEEITI